MNIIPNQNFEFDDAATLAMGEAFDNACASLCRFRTLITARELIAKQLSQPPKMACAIPPGSVSKH